MPAYYIRTAPGFSHGNSPPGTVGRANIDNNRVDWAYNGRRHRRGWLIDRIIPCTCPILISRFERDFSLATPTGFGYGISSPNP